ncbi:pilus assembly protein TadG-related protein [Streptomyces sp. NPDC003717]|uniref:pilus assembly protein TadG-related protein n=1 Tax=Streptomyces sp. NPDC003717 TaxID=3154276 RepID=UPI0033B33BCF
MFPIYITVVGGLLFLALVYLAVGQAAATRSRAQTAADAAALAAALETRDRLTDEWLANFTRPAAWQDIFAGHASVPNGCWRAEDLAAANDASVECGPYGLLGYTVVATTNHAVGDTIVPGTETKKATESATAVVEARCSVEPSDTATDDGTDGNGADEALPRLICDGQKIWDLKPDDLVNRPRPEDLFDVHLSDR